MPKVEELSRELQAEVGRMYGLYREAIPAEDRARVSFDDWVASLQRQPKSPKSDVGTAVDQVAGNAQG